MNSQEMPSAPVPEQPAPRGKLLFFPRPIAWAVLVIALAASAGGWFIAWQQAESEAHKQFDEEAGRITAALTERMQIYEDVLHGAVGSVLRRATPWSERNGVPTSRAFRSNAAFRASMAWALSPGCRATTWRSFSGRPARTRPPILRCRRREPTAICSSSSISNPNLGIAAMLGRDISVDLVQRAVAERARDTGRATLSGVVTLRDEVSHAGTRMSHAAAGLSAAGCLRERWSARRETLEGWVFARFITGQLMREVLRDKHPGIHFRIHDADDLGGGRLVFDNDPEP